MSVKKIGRVMLLAGVAGGWLLASASAVGQSGTAAGGVLVIRGQTEAIAKVEVPAQTKGTLAEVNVTEGQVVKKGQALARLDDAIQRATVDLAKLEVEATAEMDSAIVQVEFAKVELEKWEKSPVATDTEKRQKRLNLRQSELVLAQKKEQKQQKTVALQREQIALERMTIRSPIEGSVLRVNKSAGEATDETPLVVVVQITKLNAVFYPPKQVFGKVKVGDKVLLELQTEPVVKREGVVVAVDPIIDPASQLFRVKIEVDNGDGKVPAGTGAVWGR